MKIISISPIFVSLGDSSRFSPSLEQSIKVILNIHKSQQSPRQWLSKSGYNVTSISQYDIENLSDKIWKTKSATRVIRAHVWRFFRQLNPEECEVLIKQYMFHQVLSACRHQLEKSSNRTTENVAAKLWLTRLFDVPISSYEQKSDTQIQNQLLSRNKLYHKLIYCLRDFDITPALIDTLYYRTTQHLPVEIKLIAEQILQRKSYYLSDNTKLSQKRCEEVINCLRGVNITRHDN